jgi:cell division protein FtsN
MIIVILTTIAIMTMIIIAIINIIIITIITIILITVITSTTTHRQAGPPLPQDRQASTLISAKENPVPILLSRAAERFELLVSNQLLEERRAPVLQLAMGIRRQAHTHELHTDAPHTGYRVFLSGMSTGCLAGDCTSVIHTPS